MGRGKNFLFGAMIAMGMLFLVIGIGFIISYSSHYPSNGKVEATIVYYLDEPALEGGGRWYLPTYEYEYKGNYVSFTSKHYLTSIDPIGSTVEIFLEEEYKQKIAGLAFAFVGGFILVIAGVLILNNIDEDVLPQESKNFINGFIFGILFTALPIYFLSFRDQIQRQAVIILRVLFVAGIVMLISNFLTILKVKDKLRNWGGNGLKGQALQEYIESHKEEWKRAMYDLESRMGIYHGVRKISGGIIFIVGALGLLQNKDNPSIAFIPLGVKIGLVIVFFIAAVIFIVKGIKEVKDNI